MWSPVYNDYFLPHENSHLPPVGLRARRALAWSGAAGSLCDHCWASALSPVVGILNTEPSPNVINMEVSINGGTPQWMVYNGKSHLEMDDDWGYSLFRKPPYHCILLIT